MEFGRLEDISSVDFRLPVDDPRSWVRLDALKDLRDSKPDIFIGAPIWGSKEWSGKVYPKGTSAKEYLKYYASQFRTIELNTTHYRIPEPEMVERWRSQTSEGFRFCPKFPQVISHDHGLVGAEALTDAFVQAVRGFGDRLGPSFVQLPPTFDPSHLPRLENFLKTLPRDFQIAIEFRHPDFFMHHTLRDDAFRLLARFNAATVITDVSGRRDVLHTSLTSDRVLVRFIASNLHPTDYERTSDWAARLKMWLDLGMKDIYFFVHQPHDTYVPELSNDLTTKLNKACGLDLPLWTPQNQGQQMGLF